LSLSGFRSTRKDAEVDHETVVRAKAAVEKRLTIPALFLYVTGRFSNPSAFMERAGEIYESIPHEEFRRMVVEISLGIEAAGVRKGDPVALIAENRVEWAASDFAISCLGAVTVPLSPLLSSFQLTHMIENSGARHAFVSNSDLAEKTLACFEEAGVDPAIFVIEGKPRRNRFTALMDVAATGRGRLPDGEEKFVQNALSVDKSDLSTIMYTSGTEGMPKGIRLSHGNIVSNVISVSSALRVTSLDRCLSFLPLCHAFERTAGFLTIFYNGASIAYAESAHTVTRDMKSVSPTILVSVPRLYEKINQTMHDEAARKTWPLGFLFDQALKRARNVTLLLTSGKGLPFYVRLLRRLFDIAVYKKIRASMGGKVRLLISGGAALDKDIAETLYGCGLPVMEGYGLTEASPVCCVNRLESFKFGSVGLPLPGVTVRITDDGEILVKGDNVMLGRQDLENAGSTDVEDGWLHTGDLGRLDENGFLFITGRKKEMIITSWGSNIAPFPLEQAIRRSPFIKDVVIVGDNRPFCGALVVPDLERAAHHLDIAVSSETDPAVLCGDPRTVNLIRCEIERLISHLPDTRSVKKFCFLPRAFSMERGEFTTTLKLVRPVIRRNFEKEIENLYGRGESSGHEIFSSPSLDAP